MSATTATAGQARATSPVVEAEREDERVVIVVPPNSWPGSSIDVTVEDGRVFSIVLPSGAVPGKELVLNIPRDAKPSTVTTVPKEKREHTNVEKTVGVAVAGAIIGTIVMGPIVGAVIGASAVYAASRSDGVGEKARQVGDGTLQVFDKGVEFAERHQLPQRAQAVAKEFVNDVKKIDNEMKISEQAQQIGSSMVKSAAEFDAKYQISNKTMSAVSQGVSMGAKELYRLSTSRSNTTTHTNTNTNNNI